MRDFVGRTYHLGGIRTTIQAWFGLLSSSVVEKQPKKYKGTKHHHARVMVHVHGTWILFAGPLEEKQKEMEPI